MDVVFSAVVVNVILMFPWVLLFIFYMGALDELLASPLAVYSPLLVLMARSIGNTGDWRIGRFHKVVHAIYFGWCLTLNVFMCFPASLPVTTETI